MPSSAPPRILVTDDDPDMVRAMKAVLEAARFEVLTAPDGPDCLRKLRASKVDLLILDVMMTTETEGFQVAYEIRQDPQLRGLPILMLTAIEGKTGMKFSPATDEDYLPVDDFLSKPVNLDELVRRVQTLLAKKTGQA
jgi:CheY-like chemotaxis protein